MKFSSRILIPILALCYLAAGSADCGIIKLKVNQLPNPNDARIGTQVEMAVVQRFLELYPNIRLSKGTGLQINGASNTMDMVPLMQIAGDISPDVIYVNFRLSDTYIQSGFLKPLDEYVANLSPADIARRVPPAVKDVCYREGPDGKKHWYCLPTSRYVRALVYRRDLFAKAGLDPNKPPRTWRELEQYARKLSVPQDGRFGLGFAKGNSCSWDFVNLVWSRGGEVVVRKKNGEWAPTFNTPEMADALYFYVKLNREKWRAKNGKLYRGVTYRDSSPDIMLTGDPMAMYFDYLDDRLKIYQPELLGYAPIPYPEGIGKSSSEINCAMLGVFSGVKDPKVARAAFDYIAFLDSDEANRLRVKMYVQRGYARLVNPDLLEHYGYTDYLKQVDRRWIKVYKEAMKSGKPEPYGKNCAVIYYELSRPIEAALNDGEIISALDRGDEKAAKKKISRILARAQVETEQRMYGRVSAAVRVLRHRLTLAFLALTACVFGFASFFLLRSFRQNAPPRTPGTKKTFYAYILLVPAVFTVAVWQYYPLMRGTIISFQNYNVVGKSPFVGVSNFSEVLFEANFWHSVYVTLLYTSLYMTSAFIAPILLALLLSEVPRGKMLFRTIFYLPAVLSGLVMIFLWKSFYKPEGLLNTLLGYIGMHIGSNWLDVPSLAMLGVLLPVVWAGMGPGCLIYLAALKTIPEELYEAAEVDGAGIFRKVRNITIPSIKMLILINMVGAFTGAFMSSEMIFAMTGGGPYTPYGATEVVGLQLFYTAFLYLKFGLANAMAWVLGFMLIGFTMFQLRNLSRVEFKGGR